MNLSHALPEQFDFYHLGTVSLEPEHQLTEERLTEDSVSVAFQLNGDISAALILQFERGLDTSIYSEMGNVIASRVATNLSKMENFDLMVSPPKVLSGRQWENLTNGQNVVTRSYLHLHQGIAIRVHAIVVSPAREKAGHA